MDTIETLTDWNIRIGACGCCLMPVCPTPYTECQSMFGNGGPHGIAYNNGHYYKEVRLIYAQGWIHRRESQIAWARLGTVTVIPDGTITETRGGAQSGQYSLTYVDPILPAESKSLAYAAMLAALDWDNSQMHKDAVCYSSRYSNNQPAASENLNIGFCRYRWIIPNDFTGNWFKITWDEAFIPDGYEEGNPDSPQPSAVNIGKTIEWEGPGNPADESSWIAGSWYSLNPPSSDGQIRVVNVRYQCYRSPKFGNKPQVTGESIDLDPDPVP